MTRPVSQAGQHADAPGHAVVDDQQRHHRGAGAAGDAGGQVDVAQQQDEDQAHRQHA